LKNCIDRWYHFQGQVNLSLDAHDDATAGMLTYQQKELMRLVLHKAILGPDYVKIALYVRPPEIRSLAEAHRRSQTFEWVL
jgi:hypothetical protein